jgi:hypothetical protein
MRGPRWQRDEPPAPAVQAHGGSAVGGAGRCLAGTTDASSDLCTATYPRLHPVFTGTW